MSYNESLNNNNKKSEMDLQSLVLGQKRHGGKSKILEYNFFGLATARDLKNLLEAAAQPDSFKLI